MSDAANHSSTLAEGFDAGDRPVPAAPVSITPGVREQAVLVLAAIVAGATPEEITGCLQDGFPPAVSQTLQRVGEAQELGDHLELLVGVLHPGLTG